MYTVRLYARGDLGQLTPCPHIALDLLSSQERLEAAALQGPAVTLWHEEAQLACWGLIVPWAGLAEAWCVLDQSAAAHSLALVRQGSQWLSGQARALELRRLEAHVEVGDTKAERFAAVLGWTHRLRLACWGPGGKDYWLLWILRAEGRW